VRTHLEVQQRHLLTHAAAMGGWLTGGYVERGYSDAGKALVREGLMVRTHRNDGQTPVYELTDAGRDVAAAMRGAVPGGGPVSRFQRGDRVYHRGLEEFGTYQDKHNWGENETSSYVLFDGDGDDPDEARPVSTHLLVAESEVAR
jgi:hypothetical protein